MNNIAEIKYMKRALKLSLKGIGYVNPNPLVGAVIVKDGRIIGEGYHERYGGPHAEINALRSCSESPEGATIYLTLEPCCHYGKTPPCCDALIEARIARVICAMKDPNAMVAGKGLQRLKEAGTEVVCGILEEETKRANEIFIKYITTKQPFVILKSAVTLDGKTASASGSSKWISGEKSRAYVQKLRHRLSAIMVGINTVIADDPDLNVRFRGGRNPVKIVIDGKLRIPLSAKILHSNPHTIIVTALDEDSGKILKLKEMGAKVLKVPLEEGKISLKTVMVKLGEMGIDSILIEGGGVLNSHALTEGVVDKLITFIAPKLIGGAVSPTFFEGEGITEMKDAMKLKFVKITTMDEDIMIESEFLKGNKCLQE